MSLCAQPLTLCFTLIPLTTSKTQQMYLCAQPLTLCVTPIPKATSKIRYESKTPEHTPIGRKLIRPANAQNLAIYIYVSNPKILLVSK